MRNYFSCFSRLFFRLGCGGSHLFLQLSQELFLCNKTNLVFPVLYLFLCQEEFIFALFQRNECGDRLRVVRLIGGYLIADPDVQDRIALYSHDVGIVLVDHKKGRFLRPDGFGGACLDFDLFRLSLCCIFRILYLYSPRLLRGLLSFHRRRGPLCHLRNGGSLRCFLRKSRNRQIAEEHHQRAQNGENLFHSVLHLQVRPFKPLLALPANVFFFVFSTCLGTVYR